MHPVEHLGLLADGFGQRLRVERECLSERGGDVVDARVRRVLDDPLSDLDPAVEHVLGLGERGLRVGDRAVVGEHHALGAQLGEAPQAVHRLLEVEVGRRGCRAEDAEVGQEHADGVAHQKRPGVLVQDRVVVLGVPWGIDEHEFAAVAHVDPVPVTRGDKAVLRDRGHAPVEAIEQRAVDARGAVDEPARVDEVARAALVHDHGGVGEVGGEVPDGAGVIEVDVGDDDPAQVGRAESEGVERRVHGGDARLRSGLDQCGHRPVDQEPRGELIHAAQQRVELMDPGCDVNRVAHGSRGPPAMASGSPPPAGRARPATP